MIKPKTANMFKYIFCFLFYLINGSTIAQVHLDLLCSQSFQEKIFKKNTYLKPVLELKGLKNKEIERKINFQLALLFFDGKHCDNYLKVDSTYIRIQIPQTFVRYPEFCGYMGNDSNSLQTICINYKVTQDSFLILNVGDYMYIENENYIRCISDSLHLIWGDEYIYNTKSHIFNLKNGHLITFWDLFISEDKKYDFIRIIDSANTEYERGYNGEELDGPYQFQPWKNLFEERATDFYFAYIKQRDTSVSLDQFIYNCRIPHYREPFYDRLVAYPDFMIFIDTTYCRNNLILKAKLGNRELGNTDSVKTANNESIYNVSINLLSKDLLKSYFKPEYYNLIFKNEL